MSENSELLWWNPPIEEETSPAVNLLLPQYYLVSSPSSLVNETEIPGVVVTDYFIQSSPFLGSVPGLDTSNRTNRVPSPPTSTLSDSNTVSNEVSDNQPNRRRRRRSLLDEEARVARRRERNRLAARRSRNR